MHQRRRRTFRFGTEGGDSPPIRSCRPSPVARTALLIALVVSPLASADELVRLDRTELPAAGKSVAHLEVAEFGRYALRVESKTGVALQVVDRMAGAGEIAGAAGERDGRLDLFLDRGTVRVVLRGAARGRGTARLEARPFVERNAAPDLPRLIELKPVDTELGDVEQRSWWIEIGTRRTVLFEAAGRQLADLRLWKSGSWLEPAAPAISIIEPERGKPLTLCQLAADLEPGLYLLSAYGGAGNDWSAGATGERAQPLHLRWGVERRGAAGRAWSRVGPLGFDRFLVPATADYFRLELARAKEFALEVTPFDPADPLAAASRAERALSAAIVKESVPPVAELRRPQGEAKNLLLVTVRGAPGEPYVVQQFPAAKRIPIPAAGELWIGSLHAGPAGDAIDATGVLVALPSKGDRRPRFEAASAIVLDGGTAWRRRFNLLNEATLHLEVRASGEYELTSAGVAAELRIEPFLVSPPKGYEPPPFRRAPTGATLDAGLYLLTLRPVEPGIVTLGIRRRGLLDPLLDSVGLGAGTSPGVARAAVTLGQRTLAPKTSYELWLNQQPGVETGGLLRSLPLDLADPLPIALAPHETLELPARVAEPGTIVAVDETGERLELSRDGQSWTRELAVAPGAVAVRVRAEGERTRLASVAFLPASRAASTPLPPLSAEARAKLPAFPRLTAGAPRFLDLDRRQAATFDVDAREAGLYVVESSGLLATEGALRTRVLPELVAARENGAGRNAALRAYLREGLYQTTIRTRGESAGHLGVELRRAPLVDGGELPLGLAARAAVAADQALAYRFEIAREGDYRLRSLGLSGALDGRLEDADGWPVDRPVSSGDRIVHLEPGRYRWLVLPRAVDFRAVTRLDEIPEPVELSGHGPHPLPLASERENLWLEPADGASRTPDRWTFALPAPSEVAISLSDEMQGELVRRGGEGRQVVAFVPPGRGFRGELPMGDYELEAVSSRVNNRVRYRVRVEPAELLVGFERELSLPAIVTVSTGDADEFALESFGAVDVRARLFDDAQRVLVAEGDDRPGDWNFRLGFWRSRARLRLVVEPVGSEGGTTVVSLRTVSRRDDPPFALPGRRTLRLDEATLLLPLTVPAATSLVALGARSTLPVSVQLEGLVHKSAWLPMAEATGTELTLFAPLDPRNPDWPSAVRLRVRPLDRRPTELDLTGFAGALPTRSEAEAARGVEPQPIAGIEPPLALAGIAIERAGCFELLPDRARGERPRVALPLPWSLAPAPPIIDSWARDLWIEGNLGSPLSIARWRARPGDVRTLLVGPRRITCDFDPGPTPVALFASAAAGEPLAWPLPNEVSEAATSNALALALAGRRAAVAPRRSLALAAPGSARTFMVSDRSGERPLETRVELVALEPGTALPWQPAERSFEVELAPRSVVTVRPPAGSPLALLLERDVAAALGGLAAPEAIVWAAESGLDETIAAPAGEIALANLSTETRRARLELRAESPAPAVVGCRSPLELRVARDSRLRIAVEAAPDDGSCAGRLRVRGHRAILHLDRDGTVRREESFPFPLDGGALTIDAAPGWLAAWFEPTKPERREPEALGFGVLAANPVELPWTSGSPGARSSLSFELEREALLFVRAPGAGALALDRGAALRFELFAERMAWVALLPAGRHELRLRGLGGEPLAGPVEIEALPLVPLAEGLGESTLLAAGGARAYGFELARSGPIGVGVQAESSGVETIVFALDGRELGRGVVQWLDLAPGRYALAIVSAPDAAPGVVRPALVGASPPGTGPPPEVVQRFLELERGVEPVATGVAGVPGEPRFRPESPSQDGARDDLREECFDDEGNPCWDEESEAEGEVE